MLPDLKELIVLRVRLKPLPYLPTYLPTHTQAHTLTHVCVYVILIEKIKQGRLHRKGGKSMEHWSMQENLLRIGGGRGGSLSYLFWGRNIPIFLQLFLWDFKSVRLLIFNTTLSRVSFSFYFILNERFKPSTGIEPESPRIRGVLSRSVLSPPNPTSPALSVLTSWQPEKES